MTYRKLGRGSRERTEARRRVIQGAHTLVLMTQGEDSVAAFARNAVKCTRWWEDLRRNKTTVYGALFRFLDIALARGVPTEKLLLIPDTIRDYILNERDPQNDSALHPHDKLAA